MQAAEDSGSIDASRLGGADAGFARAVEQVAGRLQAGEDLDPSRIAADYPDWADALRDLLPTLKGLAALGRSDAPSVGLEGVQFGDYRIVRELGRGGVGVVYEAEQLRLGRKVALKVLPRVAALDPRAAERFQLEARVVGLLQHPRIVAIHEVGESDGVPFYAMQRIEGGSLAELLAEIRSDSPGPLAAALLQGEAVSAIPGSRAYIRAVARLGIQAAEALEAAHVQGVIHRDVKPANLLLDPRGDVWITDFGMADVQGEAGLTGSGDLPGTLRYMSPEQALGRRSLVDRRTDIYSLGATLYELLSLRRAAEGEDRQEIFRAIVEGASTPLRKLNPSVPADLATVVAKALTREPAGRYETAGALAEDLRRFLDGRPIAARPVGPATRLWRWCARNPIPAGLAAGLGLAVVVGFAGITWNWREAERQKRLQEEQAHIAGSINRFLIEKLLSQASPETNPGAQSLTLLEVLDRASENVGASFPGQPRTEAAIRLTIGRAYHGLGQHVRAEPHLRRAVAIDRGATDATPDAIEAESLLGHVLDHLGRTDEAAPLLIRSVAEGRRVLGRSHPITLLALGYLADFRVHRDQLPEAETLYREGLADAEQAAGDVREVRLSLGNNLGLLLARRDRIEEAGALFTRLADESRRVLGPSHPNTLSTLNNLGMFLERQGRYAEAEPIFREVLDLNRRVLGARHTGTFVVMHNLAKVLQDLGKLDESETLFRQTFTLQSEVQGRDDPDTLYTAVALATLLGQRGRFDEAEPLMRSSLASQTRVLGPDHPMTQRTRRRLDALLTSRSKTDTPARVASPMR